MLSPGPAGGPVPGGEEENHSMDDVENSSSSNPGVSASPANHSKDRVQNESSPKQCAHCGKKFALRSHINKHFQCHVRGTIRIETQCTDYQCIGCGKFPLHLLRTLARTTKRTIPLQSEVLYLPGTEDSPFLLHLYKDIVGEAWSKLKFLMVKYHNKNFSPC